MRGPVFTTGPLRMCVITAYAFDYVSGDVEQPRGSQQLGQTGRYLSDPGNHTVQPTRSPYPQVRPRHADPLDAVE
jgi:hypothetical protein